MNNLTNCKLEGKRSPWDSTDFLPLIPGPLEIFGFEMLLAQVKIIILFLFKVMSLYTNALIHSFEPVFKPLIEIFFSETFHLFLNSNMKFSNVLKIFAWCCSLILGDSQKSLGLKSGEYAGWPINLISWASSNYSIVCGTLCDEAFSWCIRRSLRCRRFSTCFKRFEKHSFVYHLVVTVLPFSRGMIVLKPDFIRKNMFANRTWSMNFAWEWIISCIQNWTFTLRLWIVIVKSSFITSDNVIHTFWFASIELFEHWQTIINTVLFVSFG